MAKTAEHVRRYVILDSNRERFKRFLSNTVYFCKTQVDRTAWPGQNARAH